MSIIESRIAKLEQQTRNRVDPTRAPGIPDAEMSEIRRVAAVCNSPEELAAHIKTRLSMDDQAVVSLEDKRRTDAVLAAAARSIFDEVR
jgi:hypothetical protein